MKLDDAALAFERECLSKGIAGRNLWCVAQFDGNGNRIWRFGSGKGFEGEPVEVGINCDAEERMYKYFPRMVVQHGQKPRSLQMITRATPCNRKCTKLIRELLETDGGSEILAINIAAYELYRGEEIFETQNTVSVLNKEYELKQRDVVISCDVSKCLTANRLEANAKE